MYINGTETGKRVRALRMAQGLTQEELADRLHITWDHYSRVEQGRKRCSLEPICALKVLLHTSTDYLLFGEGAAIPLTPEAYDLIAGELKKRLFQQS